jgi:putative transposase
LPAACREAAEGASLGFPQLVYVADITYIRLELELVYLAVILDVFSRRVIGWAVDRTLEDDLTIAALQMHSTIAHRRQIWCIIPPRRPVRFGRLHRSAEKPADYDQHEPEGNPYDNAYASHCTSIAPCARS